MRKVALISCLAFLFVSVTMTQGKIATQWSCKQPSMMHSIEVGDQPGHVYSISQVNCTATKGEIATVPQKDGTGTEFHEVMGTSDRFHGIFVETLSNGDKIIYSYEGTATVEGGVLKSATNKWSATSGTGLFTGIKATGTCKATAQPDKTTMFDCNGDYSIAK